jgi:hypothetical protein
MMRAKTGQEVEEWKCERVEKSDKQRYGEIQQTSPGGEHNNA